MFQKIIFGLLVVAAVANAAALEKSKHHQRITPEAQEGFHNLLDFLAGVFRTTNLSQKLDPLYPIKDIVVNTSQMIDGQLTTTEIFLGDITVTGLSTLHRTGPCAITPLGDDPTSGNVALADIELDAGFYPVVIGATFTSKTNGVGIENLRLEITLRNVAVYMWIRAKLALPLANSELPIREFKIKDLGHLDIDIKGLGLLEIIAEPLVELVANLIKNLVSGIIAEVVKNLLQKIIDDAIRPPTEPPTAQAIAMVEKILANF